MRILVTNDDGISAPGMEVMIRIAEILSDDVWVAAPHQNQSGMSHAITILEPLRCEEVAPKRFAVQGTPTDSVIMGMCHVLKDSPPDLILSGVNYGSNIAEDVTYSGTIAAAIEGALRGVKSIALSQTVGFDAAGRTNWATTEAYAPALIRDLMENPWPEGVFYNINFPDVPIERVAGTMVTRQGQRDQNTLAIDERQDKRGGAYYWFGFERRLSDPEKGTDLWAIYRHMISVTPLQINLTHSESLEGLSLQLNRSNSDHANNAN